MNQIIYNFNKLKKIIQLNYKYLIYLVIFLIIIFSSFQFYRYLENNKILKISSKYNEAKSFQNGSEFERLLNEISKEKNFYSLLAKLEILKKQVNYNTDAAYESYLKILKNNKLSNVYQAAIAIKASYELLGVIESESDSFFKVEKNINNLLTFVDTELNSYFGYKLEILYLLS
ncbi:hypothetical protein OAJ82_02835, partial [Alphaproteobacteria bacterium]|nr:hypothetical protein [Alphaproteobacteria bacterium]